MEIRPVPDDAFRVYVMSASSNENCILFIKIGIAKDVKRRFQELQSGCPYKLGILGTIGDPLPFDAARAQEASLHALLQEFRSVGEWFRWSAVVQERLADRGFLPQVLAANRRDHRTKTQQILVDFASLYAFQSNEEFRAGLAVLRKQLNSLYFQCLG